MLEASGCETCQCCECRWCSCAYGFSELGDGAFVHVHVHLYIFPRMFCIVAQCIGLRANLLPHVRWWWLGGPHGNWKAAIFKYTSRDIVFYRFPILPSLVSPCLHFILLFQVLPTGATPLYWDMTFSWSTGLHMNSLLQPHLNIIHSWFRRHGILIFDCHLKLYIYEYTFNLFEI